MPAPPCCATGSARSDDHPPKSRSPAGSLLQPTIPRGARMSKERAQRRAEREREAAVLAAARAAEAERKERRDARGRAVTSKLPRRRRGPAGILAERRRKQNGALFAVLLAINVLVWIF